MSLGGHAAVRQERGGADEADLLRRPQPDQDMPRARPLRQLLGRQQHRGGAGGVVVGADVRPGRPDRVRPASCRRCRVPGDRSGRRSPPTDDRRRPRAPSPAGRRRRCGLRASAGLRRSSAARCCRWPRRRTCGLPPSSAFCSSWSGRSPRIACATRALMLAALMPDPASAVSNVIGMVAPALGDAGPVTTRMARGAALPRRHRLVAQVRVAGQDGARRPDRRPRGSSAAPARPCP